MARTSPFRPRRRFPLAAVIVLALTLAATWSVMRSVRPPPLAPAADAAVDSDGAPTLRRFVADDAAPAASAEEPSPSPAAPRDSGGYVEGRVVLAEGGAAAGAVVHFECGSARASTTADKAGAFVSPPLPAGLCAVAAGLDQLVSERIADLPVGSGERVRGVQLTLAGAAWLEGTVRDAADGSTLSACEVRRGEQPAPLALCDRAGRFRLGPLSPGPLVLRFSAAGYAARDVAVELARRTRSTADVSLVRGAVVAGRVLDAARRPVPGASVATAHYSLSRTAAAEVSTTTDAAGRFLLQGVAPGRVAVAASARGFAETRSAEFDLGPNDRRDNLELVLGTGGAIAGQVRTAAGSPVTGARVTAVRLGDRRAVASDSSGADGTFRLDGVAPGDYAVSASSPEGRALAASVHVKEREETEVVLSLGDAEITGRTVDEGGMPVAGALVTAWPLNGTGGEAKAATSDARGAFRLDGLAGESFRIEASAAGRGTAEQAGVTPGAALELVLAGGGTLAGVVLEASGRALTDFVLALLPADAGPTGSVAARYRVLHLLAPDGRFRMDSLPAGTYDVRASAPGFAAATVRAEVRAGAVAEVELRLGAGASVEGRLLAHDGAPLSGCRVQDDRLSAVFAASGDHDRTTRTAADGSFSLTGLTPGSLWVVASCPDGTRARGRATVAAGARAELTLRASPHRVPEGEREFGGIGAVLTRRGRATVVASVAEGGPAFLAGVVAGDEIVAVDGAPVEGQPLGAVVDRVRGPLGTSVLLDLRRPSTGAPFRAVLERRRIVVD